MKYFYLQILAKAIDKERTLGKLDSNSKIGLVQLGFHYGRTLRFIQINLGEAFNLRAITTKILQLEKGSGNFNKTFSHYVANTIGKIGK